MTLEEMREHEWIVSWSGGKDSTATILLMKEHKIPIKAIVYVRMMWDDTLPATLPIMTDFVDNTAEIFRGWGYTVEIVKGKHTALELAERRFKRSGNQDRNGKRYGISAFARGHCGFTGVKQDTIQAIGKSHASDYEMIGYAADETKRIHRLGGKKQSIMVELGITEADARKICEDAGLLSPLYQIEGIGRDGCWFCPNANKAERELLKREHPELVEKIEEICAWGGYSMRATHLRNNWLKDFLQTREWIAKYDLEDHSKPKEEKAEEQLPGQMSIFDYIEN